MNDLIYKDKSFKIMRAMIFCLSAWFYATVAIFAESFPNRPTAGEMNNIVVLGTECVRGVNERCWATQYQTNPVAYRVEPFTNTAGFYLDQSARVNLDDKAKSLVFWYANPETVYDGTTNIAMLSVPGLWAELVIGDHMDKFIGTPAIGTNAATYSDYPWRIYVTNMQERYTVLNALKINSFANRITYTNYEYKATIPQGTNYADSVAKFAASSWQPRYDDQGVLACMDNVDQTWNQQRNRAQHLILGGYSTNLAINKLEAYCYLTSIQYFWDGDAIVPGSSNTYVRITEIVSPIPSTFPYVDSEMYGDSDSPIGPNPSYPGEWNYGWCLGSSLGNQVGSVGAKAVLIDWDFRYCTDEW